MSTYIERLREAAKRAEEVARSEAEEHYAHTLDQWSQFDEDIAYAQGVRDILGHLMVNPEGRPVDIGQVAACASQLAKILEQLED